MKEKIGQSQFIYRNRKGLAERVEALFEGSISRELLESEIGATLASAIEFGKRLERYNVKELK